MRAVFATLMLLFQLQPLLGAVACLGLFDRQPRQECTMPDHAGTPASSITLQQATSHSCQSAAMCAPASLAIPMVPVGLESATSPLHRVGALAVSRPHGISLPPPARPPSA